MKFLRFLFSGIISVGLVFILNNQLSLPQIGDLPPLGKLLDPVNGFWQNAETDPLELNFKSNFPQLKEEVKIQFEENLIPHIFANNEYDLYFTQGYITAYHRLWQMEFMTRVAAGRVSEVLGERALEFDRLQRRKGLKYGAENSLKEMEKEEDRMLFLKAYTDGVNAYIDQLEYKQYPIEYKLLDYKPEEWSVIKNFLLVKYMADDLSGSDYDLQNTNAVQMLGKERFDFLFPDIPEEIDPIIPVNKKWDFDPVEVAQPESFEILNKFTPFQPELKEEGLGSNNWAVSGSKTISGNTILCNDPHLSFTLPSIWYAQQLKTPDLNVYGVTIPGIPGVLLGFNDSLAWGLTNAPRDVRDWYQITFKDKERDDYLYDGKWLKTQKRIEKIGIRGDDNFIDTVIYTHYGPVVYDRGFMGDTTIVNFALRWTAHNPSLELLAIYGINYSDNITSLQEALFYFECPPQNVAVATRSGNIGIFIQGKFPLKWEEQGKFLMDGSNPIYEWQDYIPDEHDAGILNPERGFISSANQHPFASDYPYYYYNNTEQHFRNKRINEVLRNISNATVEDMKELQLDNFHLPAAQALPVMIDSLDSTRLNVDQFQMLNTLKNWDYNTNPEQIAPSYFKIWWEEFENLLWDEFDKEIALVKPDEFITIKILNEYPQDSAFDITDTPEKESINDILTQSFIAASDSISKWKEENNSEDPLWYRVKNTRLMHMTSLRPFSKYEVETGGSKNIVNANGARSGASWRQVIEMGEEIDAWGIYPGGQSGNPGNPAYDTFVESWAEGEYFRIYFWENAEDREEAVKTIQLNRSSNSN